MLIGFLSAVKAVILLAAEWELKEILVDTILPTKE